MAEQENSKDLISVLWSGADILRSKMDANEYKNYLLGIVFYKYLSDSFLIKVYDMICDGKPQTLKEALDVYIEELKGEDAQELKEEMIMIEEIEERMPKIKENVQEILNNKQREKVRQEKKIEERRNSRI